MYFKSWLIKNHLHDRNPVGDLARDVKEDKKFPSRTNDRERIEMYLEFCGACDGCMEAFDRAWTEFVQC